MASKILGSKKVTKSFKYSDATAAAGIGGGGCGSQYRLKRPNVFVGSGSEGVLQSGDRILSINKKKTDNVSHIEANNLFKNSGTKVELEVGRVGQSATPHPAKEQAMFPPQYQDQQKVHSQAKSVLTSHLSSLIDPTAGSEVGGRGDRQQTETVRWADQQPVEAVRWADPPLPQAGGSSCNSSQTLPIGNQPYRTTPLIVPDPKTIHEAKVDTMFTTTPSTLQRNNTEPYRNKCLSLANPKTIHDVGDVERKFCTASSKQQNEPYRNKCLTLANPKTILDVGEAERKFCTTSSLDKQNSEPYRNQCLTLANPKTILDVGEAGRKYCSSSANENTEPYRTTPLVLANPRTIHDAGEPERKYCTTTHDNEPKPYRTASLVMPGPKTINEVGAGAPTYQPYRGPQYNTQIHKGGPQAAAHGLYNSPLPLYSEETLADEPTNPGYVQVSKPQLPTAAQQQQTAGQTNANTFKVVKESELGSAKSQPASSSVGRSFEKQLGGVGVGGERPNSQASDRPKEVGPPKAANSINQSASFKKVMYSVLGESEF